VRILPESGLTKKDDTWLWLVIAIHKTDDGNVAEQQ
jgi:hypothetical protein